MLERIDLCEAVALKHKEEKKRDSGGSCHLTIGAVDDRISVPTAFAFTQYACPGTISSTIVYPPEYPYQPDTNIPGGMLTIEEVSTGYETDPTRFHPLVTVMESAGLGSPTTAFVPPAGNFAQYPVPFAIV
jgi:hypothetical protein